jgi:uncharacterized membrane protein
MSIPLFNLIVVNERAVMGSEFVYATDRYMENIIRHGAARCYVFQTSVLITGILLLVFGPRGIEALWLNWVILAKTLLLFWLMGLLSYVHFSLQPVIEKTNCRNRLRSAAKELCLAVETLLGSPKAADDILLVHRHYHYHFRIASLWNIQLHHEPCFDCSGGAVCMARE